MIAGVSIIELLLKASAIVLAAIVVAAALRDRSASARHSLWMATAIALLALPLVCVTRILPSIDVLFPVSSGASEIGSAVRPLLEPLGGIARPVFSSSVGAKLNATVLREWQMILLFGWLVGTGTLLSWICLGHFNVARLVRRSRVNSRNDWTELSRNVCAELGVTRPVELRWVADIATPTAHGIVTPLLLLPLHAESWSAEERRLVLLHELAHVRRQDCLTQLISQVARAIWWPHPGAWYVVREIAREREAACDDTVLARGVHPRAYASFLLICAAGHRRVSVALAGIGFTKPSQLEGRIDGVLDPRKNRAPVSRPGGVLIGVASTMLVACIAAVRPAILDGASERSNPVAQRAQLSERVSAGVTVDGKNESATPKVHEGQGYEVLTRDATVTNGGAGTLELAGDELVYQFAGGPYGPISMKYPLAKVKSAKVVEGGILIDMIGRPADEPDSSARGRLWIENVERRAAIEIVRRIEEWRRRRGRL